MKHPGLALLVFKRAFDYMLQASLYGWWFAVGLIQAKGHAPVVAEKHSGNQTDVDAFWSKHTVIGFKLSCARTKTQSLRYVEWRSAQYPLFEDLMGLWGDHRGQTVLDYGCGPGTDIVGFLEKGHAEKVVGVDVSGKALRFASKRVALHNVEPGRVELIKISDSEPTIPLPDNSVDYIYSEGVLHHTSNPSAIVKEMYRILRPGGSAAIMVYNRDSVYYHLYVAYELMVRQGKYKGMATPAAFAHTTDTDTCPLARCYTPEAFIDLCERAGFKTQYMGGFFSQLELALLKASHGQAIIDERLSPEHTSFLVDLKPDHGTHGYPTYRGWYAGVGGSYRLRKV